MSPRNVAMKNFDIGTSKIGHEILINQLGKIGVILKKRR